MRVLLPSANNAEWALLVQKLRHWFYTLPTEQFTEGGSASLDVDYWLGCSDDGQVWGLALEGESRGAKSKADGQDGGRSKVVLLLVAPPKQHRQTIADALFGVYLAASTNRGRMNAARGILAEIKFPTYWAVNRYLVEPPSSWRDLPSELVVAFELSEHATVGEREFKSYRRNSLRQCIEVLFARRHDGLLIGYSLIAREATPLLPWEVDGAFSRKAPGEPKRREKVQGDLPWERHTDPTLLRVYQWLPIRGAALAPSFYGKPSIRLTVAGRTAQESIDNWKLCAMQLRKLKHSLRREKTSCGDEITR